MNIKVFKIEKMLYNRISIKMRKNKRFLKATIEKGNLETSILFM